MDFSDKLKIFFKWFFSSKRRIIIVIFLIIWLFSLIFNNVKSFAVSPYDESYSDPYNAFTTNYGSIQRDFVMRIANYASNEGYDKTRLSRIKSYLASRVCYFYYYGQSAYNNASPLDKNNLYLICIPRSNITGQTVTNNDWYGISSITQYTVEFSGNATRFVFNRASLSINEATNSAVMPYEYVNYYDPLLTWYFSTVVDAEGNVNTFYNDLLVQVANISSHTESIEGDMEEVKDFISDDSIEESSMRPETPASGGYDRPAVSRNFTDTLTLFQTTLQNMGDDVETLNIPVPFTDKYIVLTSDLVSRHIENTILKTLITTLYWFIFAKYFLTFSKLILNRIKDGRLASGTDLALFLEQLEFNQESIKAIYM